MLATLALTACLAGWLPEDVSKPVDLAAYESAKAKAGRSASEHVKLAIWCEARGMSAERMKHLAIAVLNDPKQVTARGLLGLVEYGGKWKRPEAVTDSVKSDDALNKTLAEYNGLRAKATDTAESQWKLALWCDQNGLKPESLAHLTAVTRLDPNHEHAWKRLGFKKIGDRWVREGQITAEKGEFETQRKADKAWSKQLVRLRANLEDPKKRDEAEKAFDLVSDPRAVPAIWSVFAQGNEVDQQRALSLLGHIETADSSLALGMLSVFSPESTVRRQAAESLKRRDPRDFVDWLIALIRDELKFEVKPIDGPGSQGVLFVEGERYNVRRTYVTAPLPNLPLIAGEPISYDVDGYPVITRMVSPTGMRAGRITSGAALAQAAANQGQGNATATPLAPVAIPIGRIIEEYAQAAQQVENELESDVAEVKGRNAVIQENNSRVAQVLRNVTGHDEGVSREAWKAWSTDLQGYAYKPTPEIAKPTYEQTVLDPITQQSISQSGLHNACFKAGTTVKTLTGDRPIELIEVGDEVLTQETTTGALSYQPVLTVYHNPPNITYKVDLGSEAVSSTGIHRFWKAGKGWAMARDLKPGDKVRTLNGPSTVSSVVTETAVPVFNLEVASGQSFFVGKTGALVHDNSLVQPVHQAFDREPELAKVSQSR